jgi:hypothetical protein
VATQSIILWASKQSWAAWNCITSWRTNALRGADEMGVIEGVRPRMDCEELVYPWAPGPLRLAVPLEVTLSLLGA